MTPEEKARVSQTLAAAARAHLEYNKTRKNVGTVKCPRCEGTVRWVRAPSNGHISGSCQTEGCTVKWIQ